MNLVSWNLRGLNRTPMHKEIRSLIAQHQFSMIGLVETKVKASNMAFIRKAVCPAEWSDFANPLHNDTTRIWVFWSLTIKVSIIDSSEQHIHCKILFNSSTLFVTFCYGFNSALERIPLWNSLVHCATISNSHPWILLGDFNVIRWDSEKKGGPKPNLYTMKDFNDCIDSCGLDEFKLAGKFFTWSNSSFGEARTECRLDRVLTNSAFNLTATNYRGTALNPGISDHSPISISGAPIANRALKTPFKYFNYWAKEGIF